MAYQATTTSDDATSSSFEEQVAVVIERLRRSLAAVVSTLPGSSERGENLAAALGIDTKLAWRIGHVLDRADVFNAARFIPGAQGLNIVLRAAQKRGASKGLIASAKSAFGSFSDLVQTHAGSRRAFDMMLAAHVREEKARGDEEHRRQMFEGGSYVWGVQTRVLQRLDILAPSKNPGMYDLASIRGFVDLRRFRSDVPWRIGRGFSVDDADNARVEFRREPLDERQDGNAALDGLPLLRDFCSKPLPACRRVELPNGASEYELVEGAVGNTGLITCVTGELIRSFEPRYRTQGFHDLALVLHMRTPSEIAVYDLLIHRDIFGRRIEPQLLMYGDLFSERIAPRYREADRLPMEEQIEYLGNGADGLALADVPQLPELARFVLDRCGFDGPQFDAYRVRIKYPPIPATIVIKHDLPEAP